MLIVVVVVAPVQRTVRAAASGAFVGAEQTGFFYDLHGTRTAAFSSRCQETRHSYDPTAQDEEVVACWLAYESWPGLPCLAIYARAAGDRSRCRQVVRRYQADAHEE